MEHTKPLFCVSISITNGVRFQQLKQYEVEETGFRIRVPFTTVNFIRKSDIAQPINRPGATFVFGFDPINVMKAAQMAYDDVLSGIQEEVKRQEANRKKMTGTWGPAHQEAQTAMDQLRALGGVPAVGASPAPLQDRSPRPEPVQEAPQGPASEDPAPAPSRASGGDTGPQAPPGKGSGGNSSDGIERRQFEVYFAGAKTSVQRSKACGYYARVKELSTNRVSEVKGNGKVDNLTRLQLVVLKSALAKIPASTSQTRSEVTVFCPDQFVVDIINRNLRYWATHDWKKKKDKSEVDNRDLLEIIYQQMQQMTVTAKLCTSDDTGYTFCLDEAKALADEKYQQGLSQKPARILAPGTYTGS